MEHEAEIHDYMHSTNRENINEHLIESLRSELAVRDQKILELQIESLNNRQLKQSVSPPLDLNIPIELRCMHCGTKVGSDYIKSLKLLVSEFYQPRYYLCPDCFRRVKSFLSGGAPE